MYQYRRRLAAPVLMHRKISKDAFGGENETETEAKAKTKTE